jgi:hypothetical protein
MHWMSDHLGMPHLDHFYVSIQLAASKKEKNANKKKDCSKH